MCNNSAPTSAQLPELLKTLLKAPIRTFLIIDALDECQGSGTCDRGKVLDALSVLKGLRRCNLSIFVTSRPEVDIKHAMDKICDVKVDVQPNLTGEDIRIHVRTQISTDPRLNRWQQPIKDEIEQELSSCCCAFLPGP